jgi:hypothetical protein
MDRYQTLCQLGIAVFSMFTILCGYGAYHFGKKQDEAKIINEKKS